MKGEAHRDSIAALMSEIGLSLQGVGSGFGDNVVQYPSMSNAREGLELITAFARIRDPETRAKLLAIFLKAGDR